MPAQIRVVPIIPGALSVPKVVQNIMGELTSTGGRLVRGFVPTVATWDGDRPSFTFKTGKNAKEAWVHCYPAGAPVAVEKWERINDGVPGPYLITPRRAKNLVFPFQGVGKSYRAKTQKGFLGSRPGGKVGPIVRRKSVMHPGIKEPREWSKTLADREEGPFATRIQEAVNRGLTP